MRVLSIKMPDNSVWEVPVATIIDKLSASRALDSKDETIEETVDSISVSDLNDLIVHSDLKFSDISDEARCVSNPVIDYEFGFINGDKVINEVEV